MSRGFVLWFTGLSGSGKSTLTSLLAAELRRRGVHVETLDGDEIRKQLSRGLGFSRQDRDENVRRVGFVAKLVARSGACAIAAAISPYRDVRDEVRGTIDRFVEIYTECPISVLAERDPKGLYKRALAGEIKNFTGVDDPYQEPPSPEVHLHTDRETPAESVARILAFLEARGHVPAWGKLLEGAQSARPGAELVPPHGSDLVDRSVRGEEAVDLLRRAEGMPALSLDAAASAELRAIASGAYSPLRGFMTRKDYLRVVREMRIESGLPWACPVTLPVPASLAGSLATGGELALRDPTTGVVAILTVEDVFPPDPEEAAVRPLDAGVLHVGGEIRYLPRPAGDAAPGPAAIRRELARRGFRRVVSVQGHVPPGSAAEPLLRAALLFADGLLVQLAGDAPGDPPASATVQAWEAFLRDGFGADAALLHPVPGAPRLPPRRSVIHGAISARNHGASHLLPLPGARDLRGALDCYGAGEVGVEILAADDPAP